MIQDGRNSEGVASDEVRATAASQSNPSVSSIAGIANALGFDSGETCNRNGCDGVIKEGQREGDCSCHISPPCSNCTAPREYCPVCDWRLVDDETTFNDFKVGPVKSNGAWTHYRPRPLDPTKIDYRIRSHTNSSQICEGVYPPSDDADADRKAVLERVKGTFGGRFEQFGNGRFRYVAYTD